MSRKFFSGLTDQMMTKHSNGPNRQRTNFYWPNETNSEEFVSARNRMRNRSMSTASLMSHSQASTDTEESKRRKSQQNQSKIEFYDMADIGTDNESVYSRSNDPTREKKLQTLKSRIEFYDFVDTDNQQRDEDVQSVIEQPVVRKTDSSVIENKTIPIIVSEVEKNQKINLEEIELQNDKREKGFENEQDLTQQQFQNLKLNSEIQQKNNNTNQSNEGLRRKKQQCMDSFSDSDDEDHFYREKNLVIEDRRPPMRYHSTPQRSTRSHPRRFTSDYLDFDDEVYFDRNCEPSLSSRRSKYRKPENMPPRVSRRRDYSPELSDEEFFDYRGGSKSRLLTSPGRHRLMNRYDDDDHDSYYRERPTVTRRLSRNGGYESEMDVHRSSKISPPDHQISPQNQNHYEKLLQNGYSSGIDSPIVSSGRPPVNASLSRTDSINEARQRHHVNLKSNIFHNDPEYNVLVQQQKPLSVREFAARQRVGVGLPDI
ncbi:CLUMA_CG006002, isoform A [Clunio marinus]|uniref:CLUMA_CG006002, isoform A n=1 Tax=Clunio marinus TaxID=568069 RepID=A0A1J1HWS1_9DIPT|nr:CLUMA_CG006002, isoform A [Clunio marinus]